jgi:hypothetical protein
MAKITENKTYNLIEMDSDELDVLDKALNDYIRRYDQSELSPVARRLLDEIIAAKTGSYS